MKRAVAAIAALLLLSGCFSHGDDGRPDVDATALQVPILADAPLLDRRDQAGEWDAALPVTGTFSIRDGSPAVGDYPFEVRLGHDDKWLFAFVKVGHVPPNPFNGKSNPDGSDKHGFGFDMFLDTELSDTLQPPADWKHFQNLREHGSGTDDGYLKAGEWTLQEEGGDPENKPWDGDRPGSGTWGRGWFSGSDLLWEIYVPLKNDNEDHDGFQLGPGGIFRMGLMFTVAGTPNLPYDAEEPHDTWPGDGYTPNGHYDPTTWLRLQLA